MIPKDWSPHARIIHNPDDITPEQRVRCKDFIADVLDELKRAEELYPRPAMSPAEGFFWLQEEFDELKLEIYKSPGNRNFAMMRKEAVQVAAMALRFLKECCPKNI